ncbi:MAG: Gfo/Idh/MocA family protein [Chloroflexota bacterium]
MTMRLALVGCGGMGLRHLYGLMELKKHFDTFQLTAVCDLHEAAASHLAAEAEKALGERPRVYTGFDQMLELEPGLDAVDITTDSRMHHRFAIAAMEAGLHVMTEKPMGVTLKACRQMIRSAAATNKTLAVAENYRRDPVCRLARALLQSGAIGQPRFVLDVSVGAGGSALMHDTAWRAMKERGGGFVIEQGVHIADLLLYYLGGVDRVTAEAAVLERRVERRGMSENLRQFYGHRVEEPEHARSQHMEATAADSGFAVLRFHSGAIGQLTMTNASHGHSVGLGTIHGSTGALIMPAARRGQSPELRLEGRHQPVSGDELLEFVPGFRLDHITAPFFGGDRMASYDMPFEQADRTLVAIELQDFAEAIFTGRQPEVDGRVGMEAAGLAYAVLESGETGAPVRMEDVLSGRVEAYQQPINEANNI